MFNVLNIQRFSLHDGPGIRTTVFLKGCDLRCFWCHNPESRSARRELLFHAQKCIGCGACASVCPARESSCATARFTDACTACGACAGVCYAGALEIAGREMSEDALCGEILRDATVCRRSGGGVTFSGGEPLLQWRALASLLPRLRQAGIHTAVETAAGVDWSCFEAVLPHIDLFMCDIKHMDDAVHREVTGVGNGLILENLRRLAAGGASLVLRTPVIPGVNDSPEAIGEIGAFVGALGALAGQAYPYELLPYHDLGSGKFRAMGLPYPAEGLVTPDAAAMERLADAARAHGVVCVVR